MPWSYQFHGMEKTLYRLLSPTYQPPITAFRDYLT